MIPSPRHNLPPGVSQRDLGSDDDSSSREDAELEKADRWHDEQVDREAWEKEHD